MSDEPPAPFELDCSIASLIDSSTFYTGLWSLGELREFLYKAGYEGIEWFPLRGIALSAQLSYGFLSDDDKKIIRSLHQSFREGGSLSDVLAKPSVAGLASHMLLPEQTASVNDLLKVQTRIGRQLPIVLYPEGEHRLTFDASEKIFQPCPKVMHLWKTHSAKALIDEAFARGYTGICIDTHHFREVEMEGFTLMPWQESLASFLPYTTELHVSAGRVDMATTTIRTHEELVDLIEGSRNSELAQMLEYIQSAGWSGRVVVEIPARGIAQLYNQYILLPDTFAAIHKHISESIRSMLL